jgi:hypothetical protein
MLAQYVCERRLKFDLLGEGTNKMSERSETGYRRKPEPDNRITKAIQKRLYVRAYNLFDLRKRYAGRWRRSLVLLFLQASLVMMPNLILHPKLSARSLALIALAVLLSNLFLRLEVNAVQAQKISESKNERKIRASDIIDTLAARFPMIRMTEYELRQLQQQILLAITSSVASSLGMDSGGFTTSLLIKTLSAPDRSLTVIARSSNSREIGHCISKGRYAGLGCDRAKASPNHWRCERRI